MSKCLPLDDSCSDSDRTYFSSEEEADGGDTVGSSLDHLIGTWTQAEADEMIAVLKEFDMLTESRGQD